MTPSDNVPRAADVEGDSSSLSKRLRSYTPELIARTFHECYETLAPHFGWETQLQSRKEWTDVPESNKALMIATVRCTLIETLNLLNTAVEAADALEAAEARVEELTDALRAISGHEHYTFSYEPGSEPGDPVHHRVTGNGPGLYHGEGDAYFTAETCPVCIAAAVLKEANEIPAPKEPTR